MSIVLFRGRVTEVLIPVKPDETDLPRKERDTFWGVLYAEDFPSTEEIEPHSRIVYSNQNSWRAERAIEEAKLQESPPPSYEDSLAEVTTVNNQEEIHAAVRTKWQTCLSMLDPGSVVRFLQKGIYWEKDPLELRKNPLYVKMNEPLTPYLKGAICDSAFPRRPSYFNPNRLREAHRSVCRRLTSEEVESLRRCGR